MLKSQSEISQLCPNLVWQFFAKVCSVPHPSKHEEKLIQEIVRWAKDQKLTVCRDRIGNIIIKKPATKGLENKKTVALQAHLDMVPQKNQDKQHDFTLDPIEPYIDGEWVKAKGTTLGADNGIGLSSCLAVLASDTIQHGPVEVLLTVDEEAGMTGASNLEPGLLEAEILLNTDSEQEGEVYVGCAGGVDSEIVLPLEKEEPTPGMKTFELSLKGLCGGHSGVDIHLGRGNANKLMGRFLAKYAHELEIKVAKFTGGSLRNAIPREAFLTGMIAENKWSEFNAVVEEYLTCIKQEFSSTEPNISLSLEMTDETFPCVWAQKTQHAFIHLLNTIPNGVMKMSSDFAGIVETSLNVGVITTEEDHISIVSLIRSLIDSGREEVEGILSSLSSLLEATIEFSGKYPGWKPDPDSEIMKLFRSVYEKMYGHKPNIMVIHAGLECGLFKEPYPQMDMISFGPTIKHPHSPDEMVEIKTVEQFWQQLITTLEHIPEK